MVKLNKYIFTLDINIEDINNLYSLGGYNFKPTKSETLTNVLSILTEEDKNGESSKGNVEIKYYDEVKKLRNGIILQIDYKTLSFISPCNCFWDRNPININSGMGMSNINSSGMGMNGMDDTETYGEYNPQFAIGCPIHFVYSKSKHNYVSKINNNTHIITEILSPLKKSIISKNCNVKIEERDFYIVDGVFCSPNCCLAFIEENKKNPLYRYSKQLLYKMCEDIGIELRGNTITPADDWRLLKDYGGFLSIEEYRKNFTNITYEYKGNFGIISNKRFYDKKINL